MACKIKQLPLILHSSRAIPNGEVWIEKRVPINWVDKVFLAKIHVAAPDINTFSGILHRMEYEQRPPVWND